MCLDGKIVLLVDDEERELKTYTKWLHNAGCHVVTARGYRSAISTLKKYKNQGDQIDMMILDIHFIGTDHSGWDILNDARDSDIGFNNAIVMLTKSYNKPDHMKYTVHCGGSAHIPKSLPRIPFQQWLHWICLTNPEEPEWLISESLHVSIEENDVKWDDISLSLTERQYELLRCLMRFPQKPLTYEFICSNAFSEPMLKTSLQRRVHELKDEHPEIGRFIENTRGVGYEFTKPVMGVEEC